IIHFSFVVVFFFQAEDGIRDFHVTGVQTCALPIFSPGAGSEPITRPSGTSSEWSCTSSSATSTPSSTSTARAASGSVATIESGRSEERRVGKECGSRWSVYRAKSKKQQRRRDTATE